MPKKRTRESRPDLPPGRALELLVARIEQSIAGPGVTVEPQASLYDYESEQWKPVDVAVRSQLGTNKMLVIFECRDRSRAQGDAWIDELAARRGAFRADKIVAVSQRSFTAGAYRKAEKKGVVLNTLRKLTPERLRAIVSLNLHVEQIHAELVEWWLQGRRADVPAEAPPPEVASLNLPVEERCLRVPGTVEMFSLRDLFNRYREQITNAISATLPPEVPSGDERVVVHLALPPLEELWAGLVFLITQVDFALRVTRLKQTAPLADGESYATGDGPPHAIRFEIGNVGTINLPERIEVLVFPDQRRYAVTTVSGARK